MIPDAREGATFVGPTIGYTFVQAVGMVNDHESGWFRHAEVKRAGDKFDPGFKIDE